MRSAPILDAVSFDDLWKESPDNVQTSLLEEDDEETG